jgi:Flp pilus assembly pilin Flp
MDSAQRANARLHLWMMPAGAILTVASFVALIAVALLALATPFRGDVHWGWTEVWAVAALWVSWRNLKASIEAMSAFDPRGVAAVLGWSATILLLRPGWWL